MTATANSHTSDTHGRRFARFVAQLLERGGPNGPCSGIKLTRDARAIANHLQEVFEDSGLIADLSRRSYRHENGFNKLLLAVSPDDKFHLRLHFWPSGRVDEQNIHDHRFNFWSCVLRGRIVNNIWAQSSEGQPFQHYKYWPRSGSDQYLMERIGSALLTESSSIESCTGDLYQFDNSWLHTISSFDQPVTLLLEDRRRLRPYANVFTARFDAQEIKIASPALSETEYSGHLKEAIDLLLSVSQS